MRFDFEHIAGWINDGARVLDLGCEEGDMLAYLQDKRGVQGIGVDIDNDYLAICLARGVQAIHADIGEDLSLFSDNAFDFVILSQTLQSIRRPPQELLNEMLRIGRTAIVSFPNFGYWSMRLQLLAGYMPSDKVLPHAWHNTPNVRFCTITDFELLCRESCFSVKERVFLRAEKTVRVAPKLFADLAIYQLEKSPNNDRPSAIHQR
ncbi:MAG: methionine biosynthesis protein MetW [Candidatus Zeuxoniibacter abyssi]|nr:MAG: methionine biosynthesis protein MetW [Candidatus Persebacteraceae bacterium AB1(2)]